MKAMPLFLERVKAGVRFNASTPVIREDSALFIAAALEAHLHPQVPQEVEYTDPFSYVTRLYRDVATVQGFPPLLPTVLGAVPAILLRALVLHIGRQTIDGQPLEGDSLWSVLGRAQNFIGSSQDNTSNASTAEDEKADVSTAEDGTVGDETVSDETVGDETVGDETVDVDVSKADDETTTDDEIPAEDDENDVEEEVVPEPAKTSSKKSSRK